MTKETGLAILLALGIFVGIPADIGFGILAPQVRMMVRPVSDFR
jgi:hypothetical protein